MFDSRVGYVFPIRRRFGTVRVWSSPLRGCRHSFDHRTCATSLCAIVAVGRFFGHRTQGVLAFVTFGSFIVFISALRPFDPLHFAIPWSWVPTCSSPSYQLRADTPQRRGTQVSQPRSRRCAGRYSFIHPCWQLVPVRPDPVAAVIPESAVIILSTYATITTVQTDKIVIYLLYCCYILYCASLHPLS